DEGHLGAGGDALVAVAHAAVAHVEQRAESSRIAVPGIADQETQVRIERVVTLSLLGGASDQLHFEAGQVEGPARAHVDLAGEAGLDLVGGARLEDVHPADEIGRDVLQRERTTHAGEYVAAVPRRGDVRQAADEDAGAVRVTAGFAAAAIRDLHAGHALQCFDHVV